MYCMYIYIYIYVYVYVNVQCPNIYLENKTFINVLFSRYIYI